MSDQKEEKVIKLTDEVSVFATSKDKCHAEGEEYKVHPQQVDYLVKAGLATKAPAKK